MHLLSIDRLLSIAKRLRTSSPLTCLSQSPEIEATPSLIEPRREFTDVPKTQSGKNHSNYHPDDYPPALIECGLKTVFCCSHISSLKSSKRELHEKGWAPHALSWLGPLKMRQNDVYHTNSPFLDVRAQRDTFIGTLIRSSILKVNYVLGRNSLRVVRFLTRPIEPISVNPWTRMERMHIKSKEKKDWWRLEVKKEHKSKNIDDKVSLLETRRQIAMIQQHS